MLINYKIPKKIIFLKNFPKTQYGKLDRKKIEKKVNKINKVFIKIKKKNINLKNADITDYFDSMEMLEFISDLESSFKIKFKDSEVNTNNFLKLESIKKLINDKIKKKK